MDVIPVVITPRKFTVTEISHSTTIAEDIEDSSVITLSTDGGFDLVCFAGPGVWHTPSKIFTLSNGMRLKNLKHAVGEYIQFK